MAVALTDDQEAATKVFVDAVSDCGAVAISRATAIKFLLARKFDVSRATALWRQHEATRRREGLVFFDPLNDPLRSELATGKFTVLASREATGAAIAIFTANRHQPNEATHQTTLQGVVYQLDVALQSIETQRAGLVFIYDMTDSKYTNFDYDLSQKILTLLKGGYPAKLKKVLIVTAPLWFKAPFRILRLFVREKLRERVHTVSAPQLVLHVPRDALPLQLGGTTTVDHHAWLVHCLKSFNNGSNGIVPGMEPQIINLDYSHSNHCAPPPAKLVAYNANIGEVRGALMTPGCPDQTGTNGDTNTNASPTPVRILNHTHNGILQHKPNNATAQDDDSDISSNNKQLLSEWCAAEENCGGSASSGFSDEESSTAAEGGAKQGSAELATSEGQDASVPSRGSGPLTPQQLHDRVAHLGRRGLINEYEGIRNQPPTGTFLTAKIKQNLQKNRYTDVLCYDHSRVLLSRNANDVHSDYINANYVDGYKQKNAFISTQGPLPKTYVDFWQMVWEQHSLVIVMTTKAMEKGRSKCGQYWPVPTQPGEKPAPIKFGHFMISSDEVNNHEDHVVTEITVSNLNTDEHRRVSHWQYLSWPDYGVPCSNATSNRSGSTGPVLDFLRGVRDAQAEALTRLGDTWAGHHRGPPIIVHCSAGIGRTGSFCTLDICISSLEDTGLVDVRGCVEKIRSQRAFSIQMPEQYVFCHLAVLDYAVMRGLIPSAELPGFDDLNEDSD